MTSQIQDRLIFQGSQYTIIGVNGNKLPSPRDFDMSPIAFSTACRRGYYSEYSCSDRRLVLTALTLPLGNNDEYKEINGIGAIGDPECSIKGKYYAYKYSDLRIETSYSGGLMIAKDFVENIYVAEITHPHYYKAIFELLFDQGALIKVINQSEMVAKNRHSPNEIEFSIQYDLLYANHIEAYTK